MHEPFKKLTQEVKAVLIEAIRSPEVKDLIAKTKEAADTGSFEVVISTADLDRQGEAIDQNGWDLSYYKLNPVVLWGHDYYSLPIGITDSIEVNNGQLTARGRFAPAEANPFAQQVRRLYDLKIVRATSVGFIPREMDGHAIKKAELLEFSFVPVPANPFALSLERAKELGLDLDMIKAKGLTPKEKAEEGDACTMPDGSEGEMHPNENGEMACIPKKAKEESLAKEQKETQELKLAKKDVEQIGAELTAMQGEIDNSIVNHAKRIIEIAQAYEQPEQVTEESKGETKETNAAVLPLPDGTEGSAGKDQPSPQAAQNQRSAVPGLETAIKDIDEFFMVRSILRAFTTHASQALERMNKKMRRRKGA